MMCYQSLPLEGLQVLIVDSDPDSRYLLTLIFEEYGVKTITATSALEALEILKQVKPDLLISEIRLPHEDGYSLMCKVKALESEQEVQIPSLTAAIPFVKHGAIALKAIALTTHVKEQDRVQALSVGFDQHLAKPFDIDELIATVADLTKHVQWVPTI